MLFVESLSRGFGGWRVSCQEVRLHLGEISGSGNMAWQKTNGLRNGRYSKTDRSLGRVQVDDKVWFLFVQ